ncbi:glycosyltransferase family 2 protein [Salipiger mucosus]|uniref:SAM-dependent methyltransferase n=1 Tax=Salipiger mucosus DSM 16094 TaxID=1123237 RepID=S9QKJ0_9RHOB|nr:glycosyltransferase family 2 protein [Salipiger mucosus]EPX81971.1 SAM-dependent methyltransferase [Salipiger mucosus DSM 16094]
MRIDVHIGPDATVADRLQRVLAAKRDRLRDEGVLYARSPGARNHTRLFMAVTDPDAVDSLRYNRGVVTPESQSALREEVARKLAEEVARDRPEVLILTAHQLGSTLCRRSEWQRLRALLAPLSEDIRILAHLDDPARMLARGYAAQVMEGRARSLTLETGLLGAESWWDAALATRPPSEPRAGQLPEVQGGLFWLDFKRLQDEIEAAFGPGAVAFHSLDPAQLYSEAGTEVVRQVFGIAAQIGKAEAVAPPAPPAEAWLTRCRLLNDALLRFLAQRDAGLPRQTWRKFLQEIKVQGDVLYPGDLHAVSARFAPDLADLARRHPGLDPTHLAPDPPRPDWQEADPTRGFRATQYLMAFRWRIEQAQKTEALPNKPAPKRKRILLSPAAQAHLPQDALKALARLQGSAFAPHDRLGGIDEGTLAAAYPPRPSRDTHGRRVILGCMKNEAPYILEWVAYHRAIGFDDFLIYTNGCEDGTTGLLDRLQAMGVLQHRENEDWTGNSPQQHALDRALDEPLIRDAAWIAHIDVDEFVNVRCGAGTLDDLFARVPEATNIAMTWRIFGHNGVERLDDRFIIEQFETCAPKFCPKPHTAWGFKTLFRNIGAYAKISCHRPNKLAQGLEDRVKWVNGSGADMTAEALRNGWRNSRKTIGYDLVQLNHYALRSAESFLVKRQRGRALHVDRTIGLNYWVRMDWSGARDLTIKRNIPRVRAEYDRLMADPELRQAHEAGLAWHRAKAAELRADPTFADLYRQALELRLTDTERVAYALALDTES